MNEEGKYEVLKTFIEQQETIRQDLVNKGKRALLKNNDAKFKAMFSAHLVSFNSMKKLALKFN
jgi:hypothetical protein